MQRITRKKKIMTLKMNKNPRRKNNQKKNKKNSKRTKEKIPNNNN